MAVSIKNEGLINPIEIDKDDFIVTGEMRWRACVLLGLETISCRVIEISKKDRFIRQMHENIHHNTMTAYDTAEGLRKTLQILHYGRNSDEGINSIMRLYGMDRRLVKDFLSLLSETKEVRQSLKENKVNTSKLFELRTRCPDVFKELVKNKLILNSKLTKESLRVMYKALQRAVNLGEIEKGKEIINYDYSGMSWMEVNKKIEDLFPDIGKMIYDSSDKRTDQIIKEIHLLMELLRKNPIASMTNHDKKMLFIQLSALMSCIKDYNLNKFDKIISLPIL